MSFAQSLKKRVSHVVALGVSLFALSVMSVHTTSLYADAEVCCSDLELGIRLETCFWKTVQRQNICELSQKISAIFQGLNISGIYTREEQISGLTGVLLPFFEINDPVATRCNDVLVFSYEFVAPVESGLISGPSLTVWRKENRCWKIVSHSYVPFIP